LDVKGVNWYRHFHQSDDAIASLNRGEGAFRVGYAVGQARSGGPQKPGHEPPGALPPLSGTYHGFTI